MYNGKYSSIEQIYKANMILFCKFPNVQQKHVSIVLHPRGNLEIQPKDTHVNSANNKNYSANSNTLSTVMFEVAYLILNGMELGLCKNWLKKPNQTGFRNSLTNLVFNPNLQTGFRKQVLNWS